MLASGAITSAILDVCGFATSGSAHRRRVYFCKAPLRLRGVFCRRASWPCVSLTSLLHAKPGSSRLFSFLLVPFRQTSLPHKRLSSTINQPWPFPKPEAETLRSLSRLLATSVVGEPFSVETPEVSSGHHAHCGLFDRPLKRFLVRSFVLNSAFQHYFKRIYSQSSCKVLSIPIHPLYLYQIPFG